jgi:dTDP-glucose 4,6-dehydratase
VTRVLITGAAGFIARHLIARILSDTDWEIVALDRLGEGAKLNDLPQDKRIRFIWHDLRAPIVTTGTFRYVLHLAAQSHVDRSVKDPLGFIADNVVGMANVLQWARNLDGLEKLLNFGTDETLGPCVGRVAFDEYDSLAPTNPYAASKAAAEMLCPAWANTYGLPIVVSRSTNVIGPGQDAEKFIPMCIERILRDEEIQIHSRDGIAASRKYIDVDDVCSATLTILQKSGVIAGRGTGFVNIASDTDWSNLDVVAMLSQELGVPARWQLVQDPPNRPRPDLKYDLNNQRLKDLGWKQRVPLVESLASIVKERVSRSAP